MKTIQLVNGAPHRTAAWFGRLGFAGFVFFLAKGLLWLGVPVLLELWASRQ
jgi:hypothetical protein